MKKIRCALIGSGNIGTDLMIKIMRTSDVLEMGAMVGIDPSSDGLARAQRVHDAERASAGDDRDDHQINNERAMLQRPF